MGHVKELREDFATTVFFCQSQCFEIGRRDVLTEVAFRLVRPRLINFQRGQEKQRGLQASHS